MKRTRQFVVGIFLLIFLQIIFLVIYVDVLKDLNPNSVLHITEKNNKQIFINTEKSKNDKSSNTKWKLKTTQMVIDIKKLDKNIPIATQDMSLKKKHIFETTQFLNIPSLKRFRHLEKISIKNFPKLTTKSVRATQSITARPLPTNKIMLPQTNKKPTEHEQTQTPVQFTKKQPIIQAPKRRSNPVELQRTTLKTSLEPTISLPGKVHQSTKAVVSKKPETYKTVLLYTPYFGKVPWPYEYFEQGMFFRENDGSVCPHKCKITYTHTMIKHSDAVVFHANDMHENLKNVARQGRTFDQRWIFLSLENPHNSAHSQSYDGIFNWTCTYMRESEVHMPYNNYKRIIHDEIPKGHFSRNYAEGKSKLVAWAVAHCGAQRDEIVKKLLKYVDVTVFGGCSSLFNQNNQFNCPRGSDQCRKVFRKYKFYLSFENSLCSDYVTEKYWETPLENDMVPVVFGANYDDKNSIPGSFINALDFPSIEALANYLKYLDKNDKAYNEYFKWKSTYKVQNHSWRCMLCANLYNETLPRKVIQNFEQFWSPSARCNDRALETKVSNFLAS